MLHIDKTWDSKEFLTIVNKFSVNGCLTNYDGHDKGAMFGLPKDEEQRKKWIQFLNSPDSSSLKSLFFVYDKHFEVDLVKRNEKRMKLDYKLKSVPIIIFSESQETDKFLVATSVNKTSSSKTPKNKSICIFS